jgi:hypothetical protein
LDCSTQEREEAGRRAVAGGFRDLLWVTVLLAVFSQRQRRRWAAAAAMERFQQMFMNSMGGAQGGGAAQDTPVVDTAEKVHISSLALLKMLKHGERLAKSSYRLWVQR